MAENAGPGDLALAFVGTMKGRAGDRLDDLRTAADLAAWMRRAGVVDVPPSVTADDLGAAVELRETVYRAARDLLLGRPPAAADVASLNAAAAAAPPVPRLSRHGRVVRGGDLPAGFSAVARDALTLWEPTTGAVLKWCDDDTCRRLFLDRSRGHRRRWCDMAGCGDRAKARAYRGRRRAAASTGDPARHR